MVKVNVSPPRERVVTITLKESEAETLRAVCQHVGGHDELSRRKTIDDLDFALVSAGVALPLVVCVEPDSGIIFVDRDEEEHAD